MTPSKANSSIATHPNATTDRPPSQFTLWALFEYTTLCCVLAALTSLIGITAGLCLMAFGLALLLRQGWIALLVLAASFAGASSTHDLGFHRELAITLFAGFFCLWRIVRHPTKSPF